MEGVTIEVKYHDDSKEVLERDRNGDWFYSEVVPKDTKHEDLAIKNQEVHPNSITHYCAEALLAVIQGQPRR